MSAKSMRALYWQRRAAGKCVCCGKKLSEDSEYIQCFADRKRKAAWGAKARAARQKAKR